MRRLLLVGLIIGLVSVSTAQADTITYAFQGTFAWYSDLPGFAPGESFSGTFAYDPAAMLVSSADDDSNWVSDSARITVTVNGITYQTALSFGYWTLDNSYIIGTELPNATYDLMFAGAPSAGGYTYNLNLLFGDRDLSVFTSPASVLPMSLGGFDTIAFQVTAAPWMEHAEGLVTSFQPVPEPTSLLLLGTGLAVAGLVSRRRR